MSQEISIAYLTGEAVVLENHLTRDLIVNRERRTIGQAFFQPYESKQEFIYCARHTLIPMATAALMILDPFVLFALPLLAAGIIVASIAAALISSDLCEDARVGLFFFEIARFLWDDVCQGIVDLVLLPLSSLVMLTRGISTGLHAAGVYDEFDDSIDDFGMRF